MSEWYPASGGQPHAGDIRIGDADRAEATHLLGEHFHHGRLDADEYGHWLQAAVSARTRSELGAVFASLPPPWPSCLHSPAPPPIQTVAMPTMWPESGQYLAPSDKSRVAAGLLQILLPFGVGRFYTGHTGLGVAQLLVVLFTCGLGTIWPIIDGVVLLAAGGTDPYGRQLQ